MMNGLEGTKENLVLGIDIGTRNVVGTVGYRTDEGKFVVYDEDECPVCYLENLPESV